MRLSGIWSRLTTRLKKRVQEKKQAAKRLQLERLSLETLEERTLLTVAPPPFVPDTPAIINASGNAHSPILAADPTNPNNIVAVYSQFSFTEQPQNVPVYRIRGAYTSDGGQTWTNFSPLSGYSNRQTFRPFHHASTPSVTWDRQGNFYVVATISDDAQYVGGTAAGATPTAGVLVLSKYQFDPSGPSQEFENILHEWYLQEPVYNPVVAIDNNVPSYTDPTTGQTMTDTMAGKALYVAWNTNTQNAEANRGGNGIRLMASVDGGNTFTTPVWVNSQVEPTLNFTRNGPSTAPISGPQILFTQGSLDGTVESGRMVVAWTNGGSIQVDNTRPDGGVLGNRVADNLSLRNDGAFIVDAVNNVTATTDVVVYVNDVDDRANVLNAAQLANSVFVNINTIDKNFDIVRDLDVSFTLLHPSLNALSAQIVKLDTDGNFDRSATLWTNRTDNAGQNDQFNRGLPQGANMGTLVNANNNISFVGLTFDQQAAVDVRAGGITNGTYQYIGRYRPEQSVFGGNNYDSGGLNVFNDMTRDELRGAWILRFRDFRTDGGDPPPPTFVSDVEFKFSAHIDTDYFGEDFTVGGAQANTANNLPGNTPPAAPNGTAPTIRLAQDNTLGAFSPYQGRVYLVYTGGSGTDTDIFFTYDDNAGQGEVDPISGNAVWTGTPRFINDDYTFGLPYDKINSTGLRSQFTPAIAVDQATGSLVVSWYDARYDANNWRVATMVSVSIDGGETFSRQDRQGNYSADNDQASFLNEPKTAIDSITGKTIVIEPFPSNMSVAGTPTINGRAQGFGYQMGLVAHNGRLTAVWAGNRNMPGSRIYANNAYYAAGPRIIDTDSGPVIDDFEIELTENDSSLVYKTVSYNTTFGPDGRRRLDSIVVTFDRPIDATTFTPDDVQVMFRSPNTPASVAPTPVLVASVEPLNDDRPGGFGVREISAPGEFATVFRIVFQTPQTAVGTYSLAVGPEIRDRIREPQIVVTPSGSSVTGTVAPAADIPDDGTLYTSTISISGSPADEVVSSLTVNVQISGAYHSDLLLTLVAPDGTRIVLANRQGGSSTSTIDTTFDDTAFDYIKLNGYSFQVKPEAPLGTLRGKLADGDWVLEVLDLGTGDVATLDSWSLDIATGTTDAAENLGNAMDQDADGTSAEIGTYDNDIFANPKPVNGRPFELPYVENTLPLIIPGPYVASVNVTGQNPTAENVALNKTVSSIDVKFDRDVKPSTFTPADIIRVVGPLGQITPIPTILRYQWFGTTANNLNRLQVTFSHTIDRTTFTAADIRLTNPSGAVLPISSITSVAGSGDRTFEIAFGLQTTAGTYSATIGPAVTNRLGYSMLTWNGKATITAANNVPVIVAAEWANSGSNNLVRLRVTFNRDMDSSTFGPGDVQLRGPNGQAITVTSVTEVLGSNGRSFDIVIPAQVSAGAYTATIGPNVNSSGNVRMAVWTGTFRLAPDFTVTQIGSSKRDYRITFPTDASGNVLAQSINGQYSVVLGSDIQSDLTNERMDANHNAGLDTLRGTIDPDEGLQASSEYNWGQLPATIVANSTLTAALNINDAFLIQNLTIKFTITTPNVQNMIATLVGPDGTTIQLFDGLNLRPGTNFISTTLSDTATTAIQNALAPFTGTYNPQKPLGTFNGKGSNGAWKLVLRNRSTSGQSATLNSWSLGMQSVTPGTGLGEPVADQSTATFRIFTMDVLNPASRNNWTAVGPVANNNEANAGQVTNVQLDPSDPSGNTAYAVGAHSGIWKTTNFMTTAAGGPTWMPLTDFGPSNGISIGSLVLIPRNNDPNRTIVLAGTGSGANIVSSGSGYTNQGIGFLRSEDGGANWKVLDSLTNFDAQGVYIPLSSATRNREFDDTLSFRLVVDPNLNPLTNENIVYAAMSGTNGGLYRSTDSGKNWTLLRAGQATDVALSQTQKGTAGFVEQYWAAFQGEGIYFTQNGGANFTLTSGVQGRTDVRDGDRYFIDDRQIPTANPTELPNGAKGRITLATPVSQNNAFLDSFYRSWVYAAVSEANGDFDGLYVSKDFGRNWTKVILPAPAVRNPTTGFITIFDEPTNDEVIGFDANNRGSQEYPVAGGGNGVDGRADEALALAIDPRDPRIVYLGGTRLLRVDLTTLSDPYALVAHDSSDNDTTPNKTNNQTVGAVLTKGALLPAVGTTQTAGLYDPFTFDAVNFPFGPEERDAENYFNLARDPEFPFVALSTIRTWDVSSVAGGGFQNTGTDIVWNFHDYTATGNSNAQLYYNLITTVDPVTGQTRLIMSTLNGVYTSVDQGTGDIQDDIGAMTMINGIRNGNIQNIRLTSGGAQPSQLAADLAGALFYGTTNTRGFPQSDADILSTGNLDWNTLGTGEKFTSGGGTEVLTDPSGNGNVWQYKFPFRIVDSGGPGGTTDFVQLFQPGLPGTSRSKGLTEAGDIPGQLNPGNGVGQWWADYGRTLDFESAPNDFYGARMAINKYNPNALVISSLKNGAKIFRTTDSGLNWFPISPAGGPNFMAFSLAFGAPDPTDPQQGTSKDNFIYAGSIGGVVRVTRNGGGTWTNLPALDGSTIRSIQPSPVQGSYEVYVTTERGVYWKADSRDAVTAWTDITGNLFNLTTNLFGDANQVDAIIYGDLTSMVVDWRFTRPDDPLNPSGSLTPYLYVAAEGGVFRSVDKGTTWTYFPDKGQGAAQAGGLLPRIRITDLVLLPGAFSGSTSQTDANNPYSMLLATTDGRGAFAIRLEPEPNVSGPRILSVQPTTPSLVNPIDSIDIAFDKGVDPSTFQVSDIVSFKAPNGTNIVPLSITNVSTGGQNNLFRVTFAPVSQNGVFTIVVGPNVADFAGNRMNQTPDGVNGDGVSDQYTGRFFRNTGPDGPFVPAVIGGQANGQYIANFSNGVNGYTRQPFFAMLPKTVTWTNVTTRDLNADGKADVIGRMVQTGEWWVSLAIPGGYLTNRWLTWEPGTPNVTPLFADFNGDGRVDLAFRNKNNGQWIVGLSNGSGFQTSVWGTWSKNVNWTNIVTADFNGDGFADIAGRDPGTGAVHVALSTAESFQTSIWNTWVKTGIVDVRAGDFTGDGNADLVGRNPTTGAWTLLESTGTSFTRKAFGSWAGNVAWTFLFVGDFNNDGRSDLSGWNPATGQFIVGASNGTAFQTAQWTVLAPGVTYAFAGIGDFNNDDRQDLAFREIATGRIRVLRSTGTSFANSVWDTWNAGVPWLNAGAGDLDGDGRDDIVALNQTTGVFQIGESTGTAFVKKAFGAWIPQTPNWTNVLTGDFNGDNKTDLAYRSLANGQWYVSLSNGSKAYRTREWARWKTGNWTNVVVADVNGDGKDDIIGRVPAANNRFDIFVNLSTGSRFDVQRWATWNAGAWSNILVGDFDGDGLADLAARNNNNRQVWVSRSTGFSFVHTLWTTTQNLSWANIVAGDFSGDGKTDLAYRQSGTGRWYVSVSTGTAFAAQTVWTTSPWPGANWSDIRVLDMNGDGKDDIIGRNPSNGDLWAALANPGGTAFSTSKVGAWGAGNWADVFAADMDGDGRDDLIGRLFSTGQWRVSLSNGTTLSNAFWDTWLANVVLENSRLLRKS